MCFTFDPHHWDLRNHIYIYIYDELESWKYMVAVRCHRKLGNYLALYSLMNGAPRLRFLFLDQLCWQQRSVHQWNPSGLGDHIRHFWNPLIIFKGKAASPKLLSIWKTVTSRPAVLFIHLSKAWLWYTRSQNTRCGY